MHVMIDLETIGARPDSAILQVAAVAFEPRSGGRVHDTKAFNEYVDMDSCLSIGMAAEHSTLCFWLRQNYDARTRLAEGLETRAMPVHQVLTALEMWPQAAGLGSGWAVFDGVWAKPISFDLAILATAFRKCGMPAPWHYRSQLDLRTFYRSLMMEEPSMARHGTGHDALDDCLYQITQLQTAMDQRGVSL